MQQQHQPQGTSTLANQEIIDDVLSLLRSHLGMEVAYLSEFAETHIVFRALDAKEGSITLKKGDTWPMDESFCKYVVEGRLPRIIPDASKHPFAREMAVTADMPVEAQLAVPIRRADGSAYGTLAFISTSPKPDLNTRDLGVVDLFATLVQGMVQREVDENAARAANIDQIEGFIGGSAFEVFAQPIKELSTETIAGYEALCRFSEMSDMPADAVFELAGRFGLRAALEVRVIATALDGLATLPIGYLSVNAAPTTVMTPEFMALMQGQPLDHILLEMTEHQQVADYQQLLAQLAPLRDAGLRIAVDDAGTGYSGLDQILRLQPDVIKLDRALVSGIDADRAKRAMCAAMVHYVGESGGALVAEGVETAAEAAELLRLGVSHAQGFYFGRPLPLNALGS